MFAEAGPSRRSGHTIRMAGDVAAPGDGCSRLCARPRGGPGARPVDLADFVGAGVGCSSGGAWIAVDVGGRIAGRIARVLRAGVAHREAVVANR